MSFGRAHAAKRPAESSDVPPTSPTPRQSDAAILADERAKSAELIKWPRLPELKEFGQMAEAILYGLLLLRGARRHLVRRAGPDLQDLIRRASWMGPLITEDPGRGAPSRRSGSKEVPPV